MIIQVSTIQEHNNFTSNCNFQNYLFFMLCFLFLTIFNITVSYIICMYTWMLILIILKCIRVFLILLFRSSGTEKLILKCTKCIFLWFTFSIINKSYKIYELNDFVCIDLYKEKKFIIYSLYKYLLNLNRQLPKPQKQKPSKLGFNIFNAFSITFILIILLRYKKI